MANEMRACVFILCVMYVDAAVLAAKDYYCRDPDTGKLHSVNTTWKSESFCGNYTCKLRRIFLSDMISLPSNIVQSKLDDESRATNDRRKEDNVTISRRLENEIQTIIHKLKEDKDMINSKDTEKELTNERKSEINDFKESDSKIKNNANEINYKNLLNEIKANTDDDNAYNPNNVKQDYNEDRYLNDDELKILTEILKRIRKSELDAIIEIYKMAQEIYQEINQSSRDIGIQKNLSKMVLNNLKDFTSTENNQISSISYWYNPLSHEMAEKSNDYQNEISAIKDSPINTIVTEPVPPNKSAKSLPYLHSTFKIPNLSNEYSKFPYYYPVTSFLRTIHPVTVQTVTSNKKTFVTEHKCSQRPNFERTNHLVNSAVAQDARHRQKFELPALLTYPFATINRTNYLEHFNYLNLPWHQVQRQKPGQLKIYTNDYTPIELVAPKRELNNEVAIAAKPIEYQNNNQKIKEDSKNSWRTGQLAVDIIDDIKANIEPTKAIIPLKRKVYSDKIDKSFVDYFRSKRKSDEQNSSVNDTIIKSSETTSQTAFTTDETLITTTDFNDYETYIEKIRKHTV